MPSAPRAFAVSYARRAAKAISSVRMLLSLALCGALLALVPVRAVPPAKPDGGALFKLRCASCHTAGRGEVNKMGPNLFGVVGRASGAAPAFRYSAALRGGKVTWNEALLDRYLTNPPRTVPGTTMPPVGIAKAEDRAQIIAYLKRGAASTRR